MSDNSKEKRQPTPFDTTTLQEYIEAISDFPEELTLEVLIHTANQNRQPIFQTKKEPTNRHDWED